ncbi:MAG: type VI secretion system baseplate subunit TssE [Pelistega sp.]|nr:type VI secretion system baseplate subunit TssE [Pelistega sp.]
MVRIQKRQQLHEKEKRTAKDRLQPALLDRLIDHAPDNRKETQDQVMITSEVLRDAVLRDLTWLLNTANMETSYDLSEYPHVKTSCVNFGIGALAGERMSEIDLMSLQGSIKDSIVAYESRIDASNVVVKCVAESNTLEHHNILSLMIMGKINSTPYPREFVFKTNIDLETGHMDVVEYDKSE